jgi:hypothetical protein
MLRLNQAALDLLQVELRARSRSAYAQVKFGDALKSLDRISDSVASAENDDIVNELVVHRLKRLHDSAGNSATYRELRKIVVDLIPNFPDAVLHQAAKLNRPALAEVPMVWPALPLTQWSTLVLGVMVGGIGVLVLPLLQSSGSPYWVQLAKNLNLPMVAPPQIGPTSAPTIGQVASPRSHELIPTAETFAGIVQQQMSPTNALTAAEWQTVMNQWQEAIDLLAQVPAADADYAKAQKQIRSYKQQQMQAKQRLKQERQASEALKSATGRVNWLQSRAAKMTPAQKVAARKAVAVQLQPVVPGTTGYAAAQKLRDRLAQSLR